MIKNKVCPEQYPLKDGSPFRSYRDNFDQSNKRVFTQSLQSYSIQNAENARHSPYERYRTYLEKVNENIQQIKDTRIIEVLAGIQSRDEKVKQLDNFKLLFKELVYYIKIILQCLTDMENEYQKLNVQVSQFTDKIISEILDIQNNFTDLVTYSSLRFFHKVSEIHQFDESEIDLDFDIQSWAYQAKQYVIKYKHNRQKNLAQKNGSLKSCWNYICCCLNKSQDKEQISQQELNTCKSKSNPSQPLQPLPQQD